MKNSQIAQEIQKAEEHLASLRKQLEEQKFPTIQEASVGDVLEDGSIVLIKEQNHAIVVCSRDKEFMSTWNDLEKNKTANGFGPEWFIPSRELLYLAYRTIPKHFNFAWYWSSTETNARYAWSVCLHDGLADNSNKTIPSCVRAFMCIVF